MLWAAIDYSVYADILSCGFISGDPGINESFKSWGLVIFASIAIYVTPCPFLYNQRRYWLASVVVVPFLWFAIGSIFLSPRFVEFYQAQARSQFCEIGLTGVIGTSCMEPCSDMYGG